MTQFGCRLPCSLASPPCAEQLYRHQMCVAVIACSGQMKGKWSMLATEIYVRAFI